MMNPYGVPYPLRVLQRVWVLTFAMKSRLERRYGFGHLHFIIFSCYRRMPLLASPHARSLASTGQGHCHCY